MNMWGMEDSSLVEMNFQKDAGSTQLSNTQKRY